VRAIFLLVLALVAALLIWFLGIRADAPDALAPSTGVETESRGGVLLHADSGVVAPPSSADRVVQVVETEDVANVAAKPTLILVRVTAVETGDPVEHVRVNAWGVETLLVLGSQALETDEEGFVEMEVSPGFALLVNAQGDGRTIGNAQVRIDALQPGERRQIALSVATRPDRVVHGIVLRRDTREAIPGVVVEAESILLSDGGPRVVTGNDGAFQMELLSFVTAALRFDHPEFGTALSPVRANHDRPEDSIEILLDRAASIRVIVATTQSQGISSWILFANTQAAEVVQPSDAWDTRATPLEWSASVATRLEGLPAKAQLFVEIRDGTRVAWRSMEPIVLTPGEDRVIECSIGSGQLEGVVRDSEGNPARGIKIAIRIASLEGQRRILDAETFDVTTTSLDDGSYRFESVPLGSWFVFPAHDSWASPHSNRTSVRLAERIEIQRDGERVVHDIVLIPGLWIAGRVVDANGNGIEGATVHGRHESILGTVQTRTLLGGAFWLAQLAPGTWTLSASAPRLSPVIDARFPAGTLDVMLTLGADTRVVVEVRDELDAPIHGATVNIHASDGKGSAYSYTTDASGTVIHADFVTTAVHVVATTSDGRFAALRDLAVVPGRDARATLRVERGGRARLRFDGPGTSALVLALDRSVCMYIGTVVNGREIDITGPIGEVDLQLHVNGKRHDRAIRLEREPQSTVVFDSGWK